MTNPIALCAYCTQRNCTKWLDDVTDCSDFKPSPLDKGRVILPPVASLDDRVFPTDLEVIDKGSRLEFQFWTHCKERLDKADWPQHQVMINSHKVDFAWIDYMLLVEIMGGVTDGTGRSRGQHVRRKGYIKDRRFSNWAQINGLTCLEFTDEQLNDMTAIYSVMDYIDDYKLRIRYANQDAKSPACS